MSQNDQDRELERIYDALDAGDPRSALELATQAIASGDDPVLRLLAGTALLEIDRPKEAERHLRRAVEMDPDDAESRARLAAALLSMCRFDESASEASVALEADESSAEAHEVSAMLRELAGDFEQADLHFKRASRIDPDGYPAPQRMSEQEFTEVVKEAGHALPEDFQKHLDDVVVTVEPVPTVEILTAEEPPLDPRLLGLFSGVALPDKLSAALGADLPPRILLFQRNLERFAVERNELIEQIAITLYHELGHYLGLDEDELEEIDLG